MQLAPWEFPGGKAFLGIHSMRKYKPEDLVFLIENDFDDGWVIYITPKDYWNENGCIIDKHFLIEGLEHWGQGAREACWLLEGCNTNRTKIINELKKLGMIQVEWGQGSV